MDVSNSPIYLLDANMVSYIANALSMTARQMFHRHMQHGTIALSAIVEGEILYGLARKPDATRIRASVEALLVGIVIMPWDSTTAHVYGSLRARLSASGTPLATIDTLIAAHAIALGATLVTHDKAFKHVKGLRTVDWATDL